MVLGVFLTGPATAIFPILNRYPLVAIGLDDQGHLVRLATDSARFWVKVLANLGLTAVALAVAVGTFAPLPRGNALVAHGSDRVGCDHCRSSSRFSTGDRSSTNGCLLGCSEAPDKQYYGDLAVQDGLAYMTTGQIGIAIADLNNPQQMRLLGSARPESHELWKGGNAICVVDSLAYLVGWRKGLPSDSLGVVVFDVSDPAAPALKGYRMFAAIKRKRFRYDQYWGATDGGLLLVRERGYALVAEAFALDAGGMPVVGDERVIMPISDPVDDSHIWKHRCHVSVRGSRAYIGAERELVVIDVADAHALRETGRYTLESFRPQSYYNPRLVATDGDKLYVERFWPYELVEFDITNPDQPREVGYLPLPRSDNIHSLQIVDGVAYSRGYGLGRWSSDLRVKAWTIAEYESTDRKLFLQIRPEHWCPIRGQWVSLRDEWWWATGVPFGLGARTTGGCGDDGVPVSRKFSTKEKSDETIP